MSCKNSPETKADIFFRGQLYIFIQSTKQWSGLIFLTVKTQRTYIDCYNSVFRETNWDDSEITVGRVLLNFKLGLLLLDLANRSRHILQYCPSFTQTPSMPSSTCPPDGLRRSHIHMFNCRHFPSSAHFCSFPFQTVSVT